MTHQYEATRIASTNTIRIAETGGYDEKTNQFELKADYPLAGDTWHQRTVIQPTVGRRHDRDELPELRRGAGVEGRGDQIHAQGEVAGVGHRIEVAPTERAGMITCLARMVTVS